MVSVFSSGSSTIVDNYFDNLDNVLDIRFHSLEIQLDSLFDDFIVKITSSIESRIWLAEFVIGNSHVGDLLDFNVYRTAKSTSIVEYTHLDLEMGSEMHEYIKPYAISFPVVMLNLPQILYAYRRVQDSKNIYFYGKNQIKYICDLNGNSCFERSNNEEVVVAEFRKFNKSTLLLSLWFDRIENVYATDLYILVRTSYEVVFFFKHSLLYSHYIVSQIQEDSLFNFTFLVGNEYLIKMDEDYNMSVLFLNGEFKIINFKKGNTALKEIIRANNLIEDEYFVCLIEQNFIWYAPRNTSKMRRIKMIRLGF